MILYNIGPAVSFRCQDQYFWTSLYKSGNSNLLVLVGSYPKSEWLPENRRERGQFEFGDLFDSTAQYIVMSLGFNANEYIYYMRII